MFNQYPKVRPELPAAMAKIYQAHYRENRQGKSTASSLSKKMETWLHRKVAQDLRDNAAELSTLEIGAGTLNQLQYEPAAGAYDIIEPFRELYAGSKLLDRVRNVYADIREIPAEQQYDRITAIATFEHVCDLPTVVAKSGLLLKAGGSLRVSIPNEGNVLWTLGWKLTTGIEFRLRHGLDYGLLMRHEHVNTAREIESVLAYFFRRVNCQAFGLGKWFSFYLFFECTDPQVERCAGYLQDKL